MQNAQNLKHDILEFITSVPLEKSQRSTDWEAKFNTLALRVFGWQFEHNTPYKKLCVYYGKTPAHIHHWRDIPAVTTTSFKSVPLTCFPIEKATAVFHTSGTTASQAGKHYFQTMEVYKTNALRMFKHACLPDREKMPVLVLAPTIDCFPNSSLGQMFSWVLKQFGAENSVVAMDQKQLDHKKAATWLREMQHAKQPVFILATSLGLYDFMQNQTENNYLAEGTRVLDTGGYKGRNLTLSRTVFLKNVATFFDLPQKMIFNEYGMTELSSQYYETPFVTTVRQKMGPPWLRAIACDPETLEILPDGNKGILRHFDLANLDSVAMIQTEDMGIVHEDGIELLGRMVNASPRGCSMLADDLVKV